MVRKKDGFCTICGVPLYGVPTATLMCPDCKEMEKAKLRCARKVKKQTAAANESSNSINQIAAAAKAAGLSYGLYVAKMAGAK